MSQGHGDPPADVRAFLPRPGEPVERYAERLRVLHRDLTLVLDAVERGLATAGRTEEEQPASEPDAAGEPPRWRRAGDPDGVPGDVEVHEDEPVDPWDEGPVEIRPVVPEPPAAASDESAPRHRSPRRAIPRIEVLPAPSGERRRADAEDRRVGDDVAPPGTATAEEPAPEPKPEPEPEPEPTLAPERARDAPRPARFPPRPSAATATTTREPEWVEGESASGSDAPPARAAVQAVPAPTAPSPAPVRRSASPALVGALVAGWLTVLVLALALLLS